jgi:hypothetical protein
MLVSVNDLQIYMDVNFSNRQQDAAEFVLEGLQGELEAYLRRPVEPLEDIEEVHVIEASDIGIPASSFFYSQSLDTAQTTIAEIMQPLFTLHLRNTPVIEVSSVTVRQQMAEDAVEQVAERDYVVRRFGIDLYRARANDIVTVTYSGGLAGDGIPYFKSLILRAATREMQNMHDDVVGVKDLSTRNVAPMETGFSERELMSVRRYRRFRIA